MDPNEFNKCTKVPLNQFQTCHHKLTMNVSVAVYPKIIRSFKKKSQTMLPPTGHTCFQSAGFDLNSPVCVCKTFRDCESFDCYVI